MTPGTTSDVDYPLYDEPLTAIVVASITRLSSEMRLHAPLMESHVSAWMTALAGGRPFVDYIRAPRAFPLLLLPWWASSGHREEPDIAFHSDIAYSSINGYCFIRLLDNVMDGETTVEERLLPASGFFHSMFQGIYQRYFGPDHPFWEFFNATWMRSAECTIQDALMDDFELADFCSISAKKFSAAKIPVAAVHFRENRPDLIDAWCRLIDLLGCWHQMANDLFDWIKDLHLGHSTFVLSEAARRKNSGDTVIGWMVNEGFREGVERLNRWMTELDDLAVAVHCPPMRKFLAVRKQTLSEQEQLGVVGLGAVAELLQVIG